MSKPSEWTLYQRLHGGHREGCAVSLWLDGDLVRQQSPECTCGYVYESEGLTWEEWESIRAFITKWKDRIAMEPTTSAMCAHVKYHMRMSSVPDRLIVEMLKLCGLMAQAGFAT